MRSICRDDDMPDRHTVINWSLEEDHPFFNHYARAREIQYHLLADDITDIADDGSNDWMERYGKDGEALGWAINGESVQRSRIRIDTRKWMLSKMLPKVYGDKSSVDLTSGGKPIESLTDEERTARLATILEQARTRRAGQAPTD